VSKDSKEVDDYISTSPKEARAGLRKMRTIIRGVAPGAVEGFSYRMPYYNYKGSLAWFGLSTAHIGLYIRPPVIQEHRKDLEGYVTTKSAVHLPLDREIPVVQVRKLIRARVKINEAEESKRTGRSKS